MLRDVAALLTGRARDETIRAAARRLMDGATAVSRDREQALALQASLPVLLPPGLSSEMPESPWALFGPDDNRWLVSATAGGRERAAMVVVVRLSAFSSHVEALPLLRDDRVRVVPAQTADAEPLGPLLPALGVTLVAPEPAALAREETLQRRFYVIALLLVVGIALAGGYFFWQNVQRDVRVAEGRSQFVASVSHELKTPLTSIRMFAETLLMGRSPRPETRVEYLETIVSESERLTRLINNVLDFSKIEQGRRPIGWSRNRSPRSSSPRRASWSTRCCRGGSNSASIWTPLCRRCRSIAMPFSRRS